MAATGLPRLADKTVIYDAVTTYLPDGLEFDVRDFRYTESEYDAIKGKMFQVLFVENCPERLPFLADRDGDDIAASVVYVRAGTSTRPATHEQLQRILNRRIETGHSTERELTLREHLDELKILYDERRPLSFAIALAFTADPRDNYGRSDRYWLPWSILSASPRATAPRRWPMRRSKPRPIRWTRPPSISSTASLMTTTAGAARRSKPRGRARSAS